MTIIFQGAATRLINTDLPRIGHGIGVGEDELHAVLDVEASGSGYDGQKRPKMLFEPHRFYANLSGTNRAKAVQQRLACLHWGDLGPYPPESYTRLTAAMAIDSAAALKSASWGMGQIMGENHVAAGYDTVEAMVQAFIDLGEAEQLEAMVRFIRYNHLDDELKAHNWAAFARGYNGPGYAKNAYDTKLAAAYKKWSAIRDTPWAPPVEKTLQMALNASPEAPVAVSPVVVTPAVPARPPDPLSPPPIAKPARPAPAGFSLPAAPIVAPKPLGFWVRFAATLTTLSKGS